MCCSCCRVAVVTTWQDAIVLNCLGDLLTLPLIDSATMSFRAFTPSIFSRRCPSPSAYSGLQLLSSPSWRSFALSAPRHGNQKQPTSPRQPKTASHRVQQTLTPRVGGVGILAAKIARSKDNELTLFIAPSHRTYILSAYGLSAFCFVYAIYNSNLYFAESIVELPMWQKTLFGGICVTMSWMGAFFLTRTNRLIQHIRAVQSSNQTEVVFKVRSSIPFRKPYHIQVPVSKVGFQRRLVVSPESRQRFENDTLHTGPSTGSGPRFLKAPISAFSAVIWRMFVSVRQVFTGEDFILLNIKGQKGSFRMDANGWVAADFYALGNPVQMKSANVKGR